MRVSLQNLTVIILEFNVPRCGGAVRQSLHLFAEQLLQFLDVVNGAPQSFHFAAFAFQIRDMQLQISKAVIDPPDSGPLPEVPLDDTGSLLFLDAVMMFDQGRTVIL